MKKILIIAAAVLMSVAPAAAYQSNQHVPQKNSYREYVKNHYVRYNKIRYQHDYSYQANINCRINRIVRDTYHSGDYRYIQYQSRCSSSNNYRYKI